MLQLYAEELCSRIEDQLVGVTARVGTPYWDGVPVVKLILHDLEEWQYREFERMCGDMLEETHDKHKARLHVEYYFSDEGR